MQSSRLIAVRTDPATQFIGTLAQNVAATLDLAMPTGAQVAGDGYVDGGLMAGGVGTSRLRSLLIQSVQNFAWEVWLWGTSAFNVSLTNPALNVPLGRWSFAEGDGVQIGGTGLYYYYIEGLDTAYADFGRTGLLHIMLVNRSASGKLAAASGALNLQFMFDPSLGY